MRHYGGRGKHQPNGQQRVLDGFESEDGTGGTSLLITVREQQQIRLAAMRSRQMVIPPPPPKANKASSSQRGANPPSLSLPRVTSPDADAHQPSPSAAHAIMTSPHHAATAVRNAVRPASPRSPLSTAHASPAGKTVPAASALVASSSALPAPAARPSSAAPASVARSSASAASLASAAQPSASQTSAPTGSSAPSANRPRQGEAASHGARDNATTATSLSGRPRQTDSTSSAVPSASRQAVLGSSGSSLRESAHGTPRSPRTQQQQQQQQPQQQQSQQLRSSAERTALGMSTVMASVADERVFDERLASDIQRAQETGVFEVSMRGMTALSQQMLRYLRVEGLSLSKVSLLGHQLSSHLPYHDVANLVALDLTANLLTSVPDTISCLTRLTELKVAQNRLQGLPAAVSGLTALVHLDLSNNALAYLPEDVGGLVCLQSLQLDHNELTHLPSSVCGLPELATLSAAHNQLVAMSHAVSGLASLTALSLHHNCITAMPITIGAVTKLVDLRLHNNHLSLLPRELAYLTATSRITTSCNPLIYPPRSVCRGGAAAIREFLSTNSGVLGDGRQLHKTPSLDASTPAGTAGGGGGDADPDGDPPASFGGGGDAAAPQCIKCRELQAQTESTGMRLLAYQFAVERAERDALESQHALEAKDKQVSFLSGEMRKLELQQSLIEKSMATHGDIHLASCEVLKSQLRQVQEELQAQRAETGAAEARLAERVASMDEERRRHAAALTGAANAERFEKQLATAVSERDAAKEEVQRLSDALASSHFHLRAAQDGQTCAEGRLDATAGRVAAMEGELQYAGRELQIALAEAQVAAREAAQREQLQRVEIERLQVEVATLRAERRLLSDSTSANLNNGHGRHASAKLPTGEASHNPGAKLALDWSR